MSVEALPSIFLRLILFSADMVDIKSLLLCQKISDDIQRPLDI